MEISDLKVSKRIQTGKSQARKLRAEGKIPAVFYGSDMASTPLVVEAQEFSHLKRGGGSVIVKLLIEGEKATPTAIVKEVQRDILKSVPTHIDFLKIALDHRITAALQVVLEGDAPGVRDGGVLQHGIRELRVEALPTDLPENVVVDISELAVGDMLRVADLPDFPGIDILNDSKEVVLTIVPPTVIVEEEVEVAEGEEIEEPALVGEEEAEQEEGSEEPGEGGSA